MCWCDSVTITSMKMMIKVQVVIQSLAQKAVCVSCVRPFIINFRETLLQTSNVLFWINNQILGNPISFQNQQRAEAIKNAINWNILQIFAWYVGFKRRLWKPRVHCLIFLIFVSVPSSSSLLMDNGVVLLTIW